MAVMLSLGFRLRRFSASARQGSLRAPLRRGCGVLTAGPGATVGGTPPPAKPCLWGGRAVLSAPPPDRGIRGGGASAAPPRHLPTPPNRQTPRARRRGLRL